VDVPAKSEVSIAMKFDARPGVWMLHCHILDHADVGMMRTIVVRDPTQPGELDTLLTKLLTATPDDPLWAGLKLCNSPQQVVVTEPGETDSGAIGGP
jgi:hypothetical protein